MTDSAQDVDREVLRLVRALMSAAMSGAHVSVARCDPEYIALGSAATIRERLRAMAASGATIDFGRAWSLFQCRRPCPLIVDQVLGRVSFDLLDLVRDVAQAIDGMSIGALEEGFTAAATALQEVAQG